MTNILVIGACGQIGTELVPALCARYGSAHIFTADIREQPANDTFPNYFSLNALHQIKLEEVINKNSIPQVYLLAAMLSATGERNPDLAWKLNVQSLLSIL